MIKAVYALAFVVCVLAILYPLISNYLYSRRQDQIITEYTESVKQIDKTKLEEERKACYLYNQKLIQTSTVITEEATNQQFRPDNPVDRAAYYDRLNPDGNGVMGFIIIPKINVYLSISHDTTEEVLAFGVGHLPESSLPVGGEGCHSVLTGHTGSTNKTIFTDLEQLEIGDLFYLSVLGETLAYQVDQVLVVLPYEVDELMIREGEDLCTLVTCTPYGINSHRLLVRGKRTELSEEQGEEAIGGEIVSETVETVVGTEDTNQFSRFKRYYLKAVLTGCFAAIFVLIGYLILRKVHRKST